MVNVTIWQETRGGVAFFAFLILNLLLGLPAIAADSPIEIFPLEQVKPGMRAKVKTIFAGKEIEEFELEVIGVLPNFVGPGQTLILVRLLGEKLNYTGVVAGMSGSPVYIDGKLVGALSYRLGTLTREPIAGVTPFANMLRAAEAQPEAPKVTASVDRFPIPAEAAQNMGLTPAGIRYMVPIETPISLVGVHPEALRRFSSAFQQIGLMATQGGGNAREENTSELAPGGAVAAALVLGDLNIAATCTITARIGDQLFACGHSFLSYGNVELPMVKSEIVTTVASELNSFKIANIGGPVGTFRHDRRTAIVGRVGPIPEMIPVDLTISLDGKEFDYHYQIAQHPKISPLLLNFTLFNGLIGTIESGEGFTYRVKGKMEIKNHPDIVLDDMFGPTDGFFPDALFVAGDTTRAFQRVYANPFETPAIERIVLHVELLPERLTATLENAWVDKSEARPGETVIIKAVLQPYRGARVVREIPVVIPPQAVKGRLRILVSDASMLNRITRTLSGGLLGRFSAAPRVSSLEQLIALVNRERRNDRLYVSLFQRTPTILVEDKILPSVPLSQLNVLTRQQLQGGSSTIFYESILNETSEPLNQVITGSRWLQVIIR